VEKGRNKFDVVVDVYGMEEECSGVYAISLLASVGVCLLHITA